MTKMILSLIGGAGLGAGLMYLLDPENGPDRRDALSHRAGDAASAAGSMVGTAIHQVSHHARGLGHAMAHHAHRMGGDLQSTAEDVADTVADHYHDTRNRLSKGMRSWMGNDHHGMGVFGVTTTALATMALGAGLMYLMDPFQGSQRRRWISRSIGQGASAAYDASCRTMRSAGEMFHRHTAETQGTSSYGSQSFGNVRGGSASFSTPGSGGSSSTQHEAGNFGTAENPYRGQVSNPSTNI